MDGCQIFASRGVRRHSRTERLRFGACGCYRKDMTPNQKILQKLYAAREPGLAKIPDSTLRSHVDGRTPQKLDHLIIYEGLGMPLKGWRTAKELRTLGVDQ
jgi:hypothetical protein